MKIGYFCNITNWKNKPYSEILDNARDIAVYCDKYSWNSIWFSWYLIGSSAKLNISSP